MDKIEKFLQRLSKKERERVKEIFRLILKNKIAGLDIKKLKDRNDLFRVRSGNLRIIFRRDTKNKIFILTISCRNEKTYKI
ncbi:MAG: hypothetical protein NTZ65_05135 [Candidatus Berkelbacteria bacterium]|nr:hypothetical protein [Candidatus Berkelbacteria bacterium]